jgi:replication-associated recombination protein RarA
VSQSFRRFAEQQTPGGHRVGEVTSAMQKTIRRGEEREALHWATELALAGYTNYCWKRLRIIASEDVGPAESMMPVLIRTLFENWQEQKKIDKGDERHANLFLVHAVIALARAPKSRVVDHAYVVVMGERPKLEIPDYALDLHTRRGRQKGRGAEHFYSEGAVVSPVAADVHDPYLDDARRIDEQEETKRRPQPEELFDDEQQQEEEARRSRSSSAGSAGF